MIQAIRYHDISCGHRVVGHEGKCRNLHGHNYRIHFVCQASGLDQIGRVIDFGVIKSSLCMWLEKNFDHRFLLWEKDPLARVIEALDPSVAIVPFNPTAEEIARYLVTEIGPQQLKDTTVTLVKVIVEETMKCSASYGKELW